MECADGLLLGSFPMPIITRGCLHAGVAQELLYRDNIHVVIQQVTGEVRRKSCGDRSAICACAARFTTMSRTADALSLSP